IDLAQADAPGDRRGDAGVAELQPRLVDGGLVDLAPGLELAHPRLQVGDILGGDEVVLGEVAEAAQLDPGVLQLGQVLALLAFGLGQGDPVGLGVDPRQQVAGLHPLALLEIYRQQLTVHPRAHRDFVQRGHRAQRADLHRQRRAQGRRYPHRGGRALRAGAEPAPSTAGARGWRCVLAARAAAPEQQQRCQHCNGDQDGPGAAGDLLHRGFRGGVHRNARRAAALTRRRRGGRSGSGEREGAHAWARAQPAHFTGRHPRDACAPASTWWDRGVAGFPRALTPLVARRYSRGPAHCRASMTDSRTTDGRGGTVALAAGGTGGHLFPAEALARELMARGHQVVIHTERRGAAYTAALEGIDHVVLPARSLAGGIAGKLKAALVIGRAALQARRDLRRRGAALMVGFGGYPSFAPALAARSMGLPLLLHEQATRLSMANRQLLRMADGVATSFPRVAGLEGFDPARVTVTGNPVRRSILDARADYPAFGDGRPLHLLVVGGSQSAAVFGEVVPPALLALEEGVRRRLRVSLQYRG